ncbi:glycosyltransferase family 9 protein [bacterium]|nr:glycosyltransferase family 9 protein [candidate division CSSED10-310 bacterium]
MDPRLDCVFYLGEKPCKHKRLCRDCPYYQPAGMRILILKLGAMGDALRTTPILTALKRLYPQSHVTWITDLESYPILENNPYINELLVTSFSQIYPLHARQFDLILSLDKDPFVTALAMNINAVVRRGFAMSPYGTLDIFNDASEYALRLGLDDDLKFFRNRKTYQEIIHDMAEIPYNRDEYVYYLPGDSNVKAQEILASLHPPGTGPAIGLNTGCGDVFATKKWPDHHFKDLAMLLRKKLDARVYLLGGKTEEKSNRMLENDLNGEAVATGSHGLSIFAALLRNMRAVVASDTMALHLALAVQTPVIGLFGPTCAQEIDFYDRGEAIIISDSCSPCYRKNCRHDMSCMSKLLPEQVCSALEKYVI